MENQKYTKEEQKEHRKAWIEALRYGNYEQGTCALKTLDEKYCCLGVACEVAGLKAIKSTEENVYEYDNDPNYLTDTTMNYYGLATKEGCFVSEEGTHLDLSILNDELYYDFKRIADVIESEPKGLLSE